LISLPILAVMVVFGISLAVAAVHFTGGSRIARLADARAALERFTVDFPDLCPGATYLTADGRAAFLDLGQGRTGVVQVIGDRFLTRIVTPADVDLANLEESKVLSLRFKDFTWRGGRFAFADAVVAQAMLTALDPKSQPARQEAA